MSSACHDDDGFVQVTKRNRLRTRRSGGSGPSLSGRQQVTDVSFPRLTERLRGVGQRADVVQLASGLARLAREKLVVRCRSAGSHSRGSKVDLVCYGLGHFSCRREPLSQLAVLSNLRAEQDVFGHCFVCDPAFSEAEKSFLETLGFEVVQDNDVCLKTVTTPTLFFMPHCARPLYNNVVYANRHNLKAVVIVGNRFSRITDGLLSEEERVSLKYLFLATDACEEIRSETVSAVGDDSFSDVAFHSFASNTLVDPGEDGNRYSPPPSYPPSLLDEVILP